MDPIVAPCCALLLGLTLACELGGATWAWAVLGLGLLLLGLPWRRVGPLLPAVAVAGLLCGRSVPLGPAWTGTVGVVGVRVGSGSSKVADVEVQRVRRPPGAWEPASGRVRVRFPDRAPPPGVPVILLGTAAPLRPALPGAPDPVRAARLAGVRTEIRARLASRLDGEPPPRIDPALDGTGLLRALLFGDTSACPEDTLRILRDTGTTHLLSVSGFHVGVAAAAVVATARAALRLVALVRPQGAPEGPAVLLGVLSAWGYSWLSGSPVPAERAAGALTLAALGRALGRRTEALPALALVAVALSLADPSAPASASFQLSFSAMLGLIVVVPRLSRWVPPGLPWPLPWAVTGVVTTVGASIATLPAAAWWFQSLPPLSPLANLLAMPSLGLVGVPCAAAAAWAPWPLDQLGGAFGTWVCDWTLRALDLLAIQPLTPAVGRLGAIGLALAVGLGLRRPLAGSLAGALILAPWRPAPEVPTTTFLDVGQGDAALVELPDGRRLLVDGGASRGQVAAWLRRIGVRRLDVVVASHAELDHDGGLPEVLRTLRVGEVWAADPSEELSAAAREAGVPLVGWRPGWLGPFPGEGGRANDRSVAFEVGGVLFTGDLERGGEARVAPRARAVPVLKVPHHGSRTSSSPALLGATRPRLAVVSVGEGNPYGHPGKEVLERLAEAGALVLRTDRDGTVTVEVHPDRLEVWAREGRWTVPR